MTFTGGRELQQVLNALTVALTSEVVLKALLDAAEPIRADAAALAPRSQRSSPHLADDIGIGIPTTAQLEKRGTFDEILVEVGPTKKPHDHFYGYFVEYGTVQMPAQPFMRPAFDRNAQRSLEGILASFWRTIETSVGSPK